MTVYGAIAMKINLDTPSDDVQIQLIPLIDVIFCILTFFIVAALQMTRQQAINVDLPRSGTSTLQARQMLIVSVDVVGQVYVDQQPVNREQLTQRLLGYRQLNPTGMVLLYAPRTAIYEDVVQVLDFLRSVGGDRVALATLPASANSALPPTTPNFNSPATNTPFTVPGNPQAVPFTAPGQIPGNSSGSSNPEPLPQN
ncbi:MAG: biopolymer transporter ExbD [Leptolyngbyaceae bacterium]|nr:biopolymer transporter ExbD [Leptolyngbyaceae bacterium]